MRVLVVGSGAREHALLWKLRQSPAVDALLAAPGNAGTTAIAQNVPVAVTDVEGLVRLVLEREVDLTVVGPEAPLALGLADRLRSVGRRVVGPDAAAARIEAEKSFAKEIMVRAGVPTARHATFTSAEEALEYVQDQSYPLAIKADGLAAGKGVWVCRDAREAHEAIHAMMIDRRYGAAGERVVIEEGLSGPEVSLIALVDGTRAVPLPVAQDHKRLLDADQGPNTGGMGAYAPVPFLGDVERDALVRLVIDPVVVELNAMGTPYRGFLFVGLMLTAQGPRVLEYNCRLGDPEAQALLPLLQGDLLPWLEAVADGSLPDEPPCFSGAAAGVVLAASGYPDRPEPGTLIEGLEEAGDVLVFHAGTRGDEAGRVVTDGGRVLTVVGKGETLPEAIQKAYASPVRFEGMHRRGDIGGGIPSPPGPLSPTGRGGESGRHARIAVLASGEGSNVQALIEACRLGEIDAEIPLVVSHRAGAGALRRAEDAGIPALTLPLSSIRDSMARERLEEELFAALQRRDLDLVVLAGWMLVLSPRFLARSHWPILNVHPALLPDGGEPLDVPVLRGAHAVRDAIALHLPYTGVSVHFVTDEVDAGPVVVREVVPLLDGDDEDTLYKRIKPVEHRLLAAAVRQVLGETREIHSADVTQGGVHA